MNEDKLPDWLKEPSSPDDSFADRGEAPFEWFKRSTNKRAVLCREFLRNNIAKLPLELQENIFTHAESRWESTFFEMFVARVLQELGADLEAEQVLSNGRRPDFTAHFKDLSIIVEAIAPIYNANAGNEIKNRNPLTNFIEAHIPNNWDIALFNLPPIGPAASQKEFKKVVLEMMEELNATEPTQELRLRKNLNSGFIEIWAIPLAKTRKSKPKLIIEAPITTFSNAEERIKHAYKKKKEQVKNAQYPVLLAIQGNPLFTDREDFDCALLGHTSSRLDQNLQIQEIGFKANGELTNNLSSNSQPKYAGVLVFLETGFLNCPAPILYLHPRFKGILPDELQKLEHRFFDIETQSIRSKPASDVTFMLTN